MIQRMKKARNLASEKHNARNHGGSLGFGEAFDPLIAVDHVQNVQQLPLVLVDPFHHHVKQKVLWNRNALRSLDKLRQATLALRMRFLPSILNRFVFRIVFEHR